MNGKFPEIMLDSLCLKYQYHPSAFVHQNYGMEYISQLVCYSRLCVLYNYVYLCNQCLSPITF